MLMMKPRAARLHRRNGGARAVEDAAEVGVDDLAPVVQAHVGDVGELADAGVVDEDVDAAEAADGLVHQALRIGRLPHVRAHGVQVIAAARASAPRCFRSASFRALIVTCIPRSRNACAIASPMPFDPPVTMPTIRLSINHERTGLIDRCLTRMSTIAIIGAGPLGGALASCLAGRARVGEVRLIDPEGRVAEGKALDILQSSPVEPFNTRVTAATSYAAAAGADVIVLADLVSGGEIAGEPGLALLRQLARMDGDGAVSVCGRPAARADGPRGGRAASRAAAAAGIRAAGARIGGARGDGRADRRQPGRPRRSAWPACRRATR